MAIIGACMVPHPPLIIPAVGRGEEKGITETIRAYRRAAAFLAAEKPDTVVVISPHAVMYADYFHISPGRSADGDFSRFRAEETAVHTDYDEEFTEALASVCRQDGFPAGTEGEKDKELDHATMIPLYFLQQETKHFKSVRIGLSGLSLAMHYRLGMLIKKVSLQLGRRVVVIGSGDLSHRLLKSGPYGFAEEGPVYDRKIMEVMGSADFGKLLEFPESFCEKAGECGHRSFTIMAGALDGTAVKASRLSYEGPFGVGYGVCTYEAAGEDPARGFLSIYEEEEKKKLDKKRAGEDAYVRLARRIVNGYIRDRRRPDEPKDLPEEMRKMKAGAFVSIHEDGRLRGCIGTISACEESVAQEIISNAISAATKDPRFDPIREDELDRLEISVDILGEAEDIDSPKELDPKRYGVIVTKGFRRGLLLPNLDGVDTVEEQLAIAKRKAGIREDDPKVQLQRFEVVRHT